MTSPRPLTLVHLSDPQFGRHHRFGRLAPLAPDDSFDTLVSRLLQDLEGLRKSHALVPDLLVVTGDLAEWGRKPEFETVLQFLSRMSQGLGLERNRVLIVPGNHDINRDACSAYFSNCKADETEPVEPYWDKFRHYVSFFEQFYKGLDSIRFTKEAPWTLYELSDLRVVVAGLNSTWRESHRNEDHYGWVGEHQLRWFAERLRTYKERGWLRLGLVHHNVQRKAQEDEENLRDADDLLRLLGSELNLLLHGHTHEGRLGWLGNRLPVLSTGSASVSHEARPQEVPNQYQVIRLYPDKIWFCTRQYAPDQKRWIGDTRSSEDGNSWIHEKQVPFEHVGETFGQKGAAETAQSDHLATVVAHYRSYVATTFQRQTLHDLCAQAEDQNLPGGLALLDIFVPQAVQLSPPSRDLPRHVESREDWDIYYAEQGGEVTVSVEQVLLDSRHAWVCLLGAPGAGKTSLTRWLCLKLCAPGESLSGLSTELVPVRVEMRRFDERYRAAVAQGRSYDFFDYLDQEHAEKSLALRGESLRTLKGQGRLVWLLDGMDEVSDVPSRQRYAEMIVGLQQAGGSRGVITSRIVGATPILPYFQSAGISVCTLLDFDDQRIRQFIVRWHEKAFPGTPEAAASRRQRLERSLTESHPLRELCKNPLLLTLIALLNRGDELPRRRHLLYRRAVELMAVQWEANKRLPPPELHFELLDKLDFLRELGWWMQFEVEGGRRNLVDEDALLGFTQRFLQERHGKSPEQARRYAHSLINHLRERNYILARVGEDLFGFVHKTFLEYLAADAVRSRFSGRVIELNAIESLFRQHWTDSDWHEVLLLICGMLEEDQPANVFRVLQALLPSLDVFPADALQFGAFAVRCLAEVRQLDQGLPRTFTRNLIELMQYEITIEPSIPNGEFLISFNLLGPRWPNPDLWRQWALQGEHAHVSVREVAKLLAVKVTPANERSALVAALIENEPNPSIVTKVLQHASLREEQLRHLLSEQSGTGELARCAIASFIYDRAQTFRYQRDFKNIASEAYLVLSQFMQQTQSPQLRFMAAAGLTVRGKVSPLARKVLLDCIRDASSPVEDILLCIKKLKLSDRDSLYAELWELWQRNTEIEIRLAIMDALRNSEKRAQVLEAAFDWLAQSPGQEIEQRLEAELELWAELFPSIMSFLKSEREKGSTEVLRRVATRVCDRLQKSNKIDRMSLSEFLEFIENAGEPAFLVYIHRLVNEPIPKALTGRVRKLLLDTLASGSTPTLRLLAGMVAKRLPIFSVEEWRGALSELASSTPDEDVRLGAARTLGEEGRPTIEQLAASATDETVRVRAAKALRSLELRAALQNVGRSAVVTPAAVGT